MTTLHIYSVSPSLCSCFFCHMTAIFNFYSLLSPLLAHLSIAGRSDMTGEKKSTYLGATMFTTSFFVCCFLIVSWFDIALHLQ